MVPHSWADVLQPARQVRGDGTLLINSFADGLRLAM